MKFDPKAPPFWELARGGGPITDRMRAYSRAEERTKEAHERLRAARISERKKVPVE